VRAPRDLPLDDVVVAAEPLEEVVERRAAALSAVTELARLPERQRDALVAIAIEGLPGADVAVTMGISEGALRQLVHRARTRLRGAITAVTPCPLARSLAAMSPTPGPDVVAAGGVVSVGSFTAKVGALLATGLLTSTVAVLPPPNYGTQRGARHRVTRAGHPIPDRVAPTTSPRDAAKAAGVPTARTRTDHLTKRSQSGRLASGAVSSSARVKDRERVGRFTSVSGAGTARRLDDRSRAASQSAGGSDTGRGFRGLLSTPSDSGQDGDGAGPAAESVTNSDETGSASSGESLQSTPTANQAGRDGDTAMPSDTSKVTATSSSDASGSDSGSGHDGVVTFASTSSGGNDADSSSRSGSSDAQSTPHH
jgi:hypothetical protein